MTMTKITGAQSPMMTKKYRKFEKDSVKGSREKLRTNPDRRTDGQTDRQGDVQRHLNKFGCYSMSKQSRTRAEGSYRVH